MTYRLRGSLRDGRLHALESITAGQNFEHHFVGSNPRSANRHVVEGVPAPFLATVPHQRWADAPLAAPIPTMWWRAVYASTNCFAFECFVDELARAANQDPIQFRRRHFEGSDALRHRRVLDELVRVSGWDRREDGARLGWGASLIEAFHSVVGQVVVVAERDGRVTIERVHVVIDCGWVVNPGIVQAQVEGSIVMAWGAAVQHETGFREGRAEYLNFADYPLPRIGDVPPVDVHIVATDGEPGGVGEPAVPGFAPALANAVFDLTGKRIRSLPFSLAAAGIRSTSN
jgi:isoquinoline 1-oxidoreductase beta subunit